MNKKKNFYRKNRSSFDRRNEAKLTNFWTGLKKVDFTSKKSLDDFLQGRWGQPLDEIQTNLYKELKKKIYSYYSENEINSSIYSLIGMVASVNDIVERKFKEGKRMGQTYYTLKLSDPHGVTLNALANNMSVKNWEKITKFAILGQKLLFKYRLYFANKEILDFHLVENESETKTVKEVELKKVHLSELNKENAEEGGKIG